MEDSHDIPRHIAIIMDGNGRWANARGLPRVEGHRAGAKSVRSAVETCQQLGVEYLTLYAFSSENWKRPKKEVDALMNLLEITSFLPNTFTPLHSLTLTFSLEPPVNFASPIFCSGKFRTRKLSSAQKTGLTSGIPISEKPLKSMPAAIVDLELSKFGTV